MSAVLNDEALDQLAQARKIMRVGTVKISADLASQRPALTVTEGRVLQLAAQGMSDVLIARTIRCSLQAVLDALRSIYGKLQLPIDGSIDERTCAVIWWVTR